MMKVVGFILLLFVLPVGLIATVLVFASIRVHAKVAPCIVYEVKPVTLYEGTYYDVQFPWSEQCKVRYSEKP